MSAPLIGRELPVVLKVVDVGPVYLGSSRVEALCTFTSPSGRQVTIRLDPSLLEEPP